MPQTIIREVLIEMGRMPLEKFIKEVEEYKDEFPVIKFDWVGNDRLVLLGERPQTEVEQEADRRREAAQLVKEEEAEKKEYLRLKKKFEKKKG